MYISPKDFPARSEERKQARAALRAHDRLKAPLHPATRMLIRSIDEQRIGGVSAPSAFAVDEPPTADRDTKPLAHRHARFTRAFRKAVRAGTIPVEEQDYVKALEAFSRVNCEAFSQGESTGFGSAAAEADADIIPVPDIFTAKLYADGTLLYQIPRRGRAGSLAAALLDEGEPGPNRLHLSTVAANARRLAMASMHVNLDERPNGAFARLRTRLLAAVGYGARADTEHAQRNLREATENVNAETPWGTNDFTYYLKFRGSFL